MRYAARNPYILFKKLKQLEHGEALLKFFLHFRVNWCVRDALLEVERSAPPGETPAPSPLRTADNFSKNSARASLPGRIIEV